MPPTPQACRPPSMLTRPTLRSTTTKLSTRPSPISSASKWSLSATIVCATLSDRRPNSTCNPKPHASLPPAATCVTLTSSSPSCPLAPRDSTTSTTATISTTSARLRLPKRSPSSRPTPQRLAYGWSTEALTARAKWFARTTRAVTRASTSLATTPASYPGPLLLLPPSGTSSPSAPTK